MITFLVELDGKKPRLDMDRLAIMITLCEAFAIDKLQVVDPVRLTDHFHYRDDIEHMPSIRYALEDTPNKDAQVYIVEERIVERSILVENLDLIWNEEHSSVFVFGRDGGPGLQDQVALGRYRWIHIPARRSVFASTAAAVVASKLFSLRNQVLGRG